MSTAKIYSAIPFGFDGHLVAVECDANRGLPALNIVGLPSRSIDESRQRIRSAINNSLFTFPASKLTVNLAPADIKKTGSHLDLPIALSILVASSQLLQSDVEDKAFVGELALSGEIRPVRGIINIIETAKRNHLKQLFIPADNAKQAALVANDFQLIPVKNLREV
jgi:magnesium chelatase family protein